MAKRLVVEPRLAAIGRIETGGIDIERFRKISDTYPVVSLLMEQTARFLDAQGSIKGPPGPPLS
ncbi:hypothetical protein A3711_15925 [Erythrobacter sp. HI00D59]|nr:hypothetical protein A3711_15925 [Erythrobacter sp. HI00D59]